MTRIAFFGTKKYDQETFCTVNDYLDADGNKRFGFELKYYKAHPTMEPLRCASLSTTRSQRTSLPRWGVWV